MVYTAQSRALAALEILVHLDSPHVLGSFVVFEVTFEDALVQRLSIGDLPADWRDGPVPFSTQAVGDRWIASAAAPVLQAPSVTIPEEMNFLLNPNHPDFGRLHIGPPKKFAFDPRLQR
jgi:RES domain-containing protein